MSEIVGSAESKSGIIGQTELDYEEGNWTPTFSNTHGTHAPVGRYIKIGKIVHCWGWILTQSGTSGTAFGGLPFTSASSNTVGNAQGAGCTGYQTTSTTYSQFGIYIGNGGKAFYFRYQSNDVDFAADKQAGFYLTYRVD